MDIGRFKDNRLIINGIDQVCPHTDRPCGLRCPKCFIRSKVIGGRVSKEIITCGQTVDMEKL